MRPAIRVAAGGLLALVVLVLVVLAVLWGERRPIAQDLLSRELARRGVPARFTVATIGVRRQRLTNLVLGDPAHPDLTAASAVVDVALGLSGVSVTGIRAEGVRLRGRVVAGHLSLGSLDRLLPARTTQPSSPKLPHLDLALSDARASIDTAAGEIGIAVDGSGWVDGGFTGRVAAVMPHAAVATCTAEQARAVLNLTVVAGRPMIDGPINADTVRCPAAQVRSPAIAIDLRMTSDLAGYRGGAKLSAAAMALDGATVTTPTAELGLEGDWAGVRGGIDAAMGPVLARFVRTDHARFSGRFEVARSRQRLEGALHLQGAIDPTVVQTSVDRVVQAGRGTPVAPVLTRTAGAVIAAARGFDGDADLGLATAGGRAAVQVERVRLTSASGAFIRLDGGATLLLPGAATRLSGTILTGGGGVPQLRVVASQTGPGGPLRLRIEAEPQVAGSARLAFAPVDLEQDGAGAVRFAGGVSVSGPLPGGRVAGLSLPFAGTWANKVLRINSRCITVGLDLLVIRSLRLGPVRLPACPGATGAMLVAGQAPVGGTIRVAPVALTAMLGSSPVRLHVRTAEADIRSGRVVLDAPSVLLGAAGSESRLDLAWLDASLASLSGAFAGADGALAAVPLHLRGTSGTWSLAAGALHVTGAGTIEDAAAPARLRPMRLDQIDLWLRGNAVDMSAMAVEPHSRRAVTKIVVHHDLGNGTGSARLAVPALAFGPALQPDALTPLTLGIVANVAGTVDGEGLIRWSPAGVTSEGHFTTAKLDLAAAFGQVSGISGTIRFTDLLGLVTAPHQEARIALINPGVEVTDGRVTYQLLGNDRVGIEAATWPFAGGTLRLQPTVVNFGPEASRRLTLTVEGLDAARFINQMQFDNIAATGTFDGLLPLVFSADGGRLTGGRLVARGGGTLSYVGEVSNAQLGTFGKIAFDALKSLRYGSLEIDLDGALDGEIVSRVQVSGVNQQPVGATIGGLSKQLTGLPFRFNIGIRAPFRGLLNSAKAFADPTALIGSSAAPAAPVQPK